MYISTLFLSQSVCLHYLSLSLCLSVCQSVSLSLCHCLSVSLSLCHCLSVLFSDCLCNCLSVCLSVCLSYCMYVYLPFCLIAVNVSACVSVCICISPSLLPSFLHCIPYHAKYEQASQSAEIVTAMCLIARLAPEAPLVSLTAEQIFTHSLCQLCLMFRVHINSL